MTEPKTKKLTVKTKTKTKTESKLKVKAEPKKPIPKSYAKKITKPEDKKQSGRPSIYSEELGDLICQRIATHPVSLVTICKKYDDMPNHTTIFLWMYKYPIFSDKYVTAKQSQAKIAMEAIEDMYNNIEPIFDKDGNKRLDAATVTHINNIAAHKKWCAARLARKTYGDKGEIDEIKDNNKELGDKLQKLRDDLDKRHERDY